MSAPVQLSGALDDAPRERVLGWQPTGPNPLYHRDDWVDRPRRYLVSAPVQLSGALDDPPLLYETIEGYINCPVVPFGLSAIKSGEHPQPHTDSGADCRRD